MLEVTRNINYNVLFPSLVLRSVCRLLLSLHFVFFLFSFLVFFPFSSLSSYLLQSHYLLIIFARNFILRLLNPLNVELNPIRHLLALVGARHIVKVNRIRVNLPSSIYFTLSSSLRFVFPVLLPQCPDAASYYEDALILSIVLLILHK